MNTMEWVRTHKLIAIARGLTSEPMERLADALLKGGVRMLEVTFSQNQPETWPDTAAAIRLISDRFAGRMLAGAGTVMTVEQLHLAADAGARYIISPHVEEAVIRETRRLGLVSLPGALTPTEISMAYGFGAHAVKVFPASVLGAGYIQAVRAPMPHIPLLAVGGINERNAAEYLAAGCVGLGLGGNLVNRSWMAQGEYEKITAVAAALARAAGLSEG
jgi:2-dehydro-3-deoxyphosphogluconate aldolase/(4S)-4-hydroxy-2-oxoglutarate aldolase